MAQKQYKQMSCRDAGADCDFLVRAETESELMSIASEHACRAHNLCEMTPEMKDKMLSATANIWCEDGDCSFSRRTPFLFSHWGRKM